MALMQVFPSFSFDSSYLAEENVIPRMRSPRTVGFRSGADLKSVVAGIMQGGCLVVDAAPASGKSTRVADALAQASGSLVVHALPQPLMAAALHRYLAKQELKSDLKLVLSVEEEWPSSGVVLTSAGVLVARWMKSRGLDMPDCYLLHDESHESGAASAALRALGPVAPGVKAYAAMSATVGPSGARAMESQGKVTELMYDPAAFEDPWSVEDSGAPWAAAGAEGHLLLFEDDTRRAQSLVQAYNVNGVTAHRLHARMPVEHFLGVLDRIDESGYSIHAMVADSSFRSAHTVPNVSVVDSGVVRRLVVDSAGRAVQAVRPIYEYERVQSMARGGRLPGQKSVYWRPLGALEAKMCDLEQTDMEAFALICRCLGYKPPVEVAGTKMAKGEVPRDVSAALSSKTPLAMLGPEQLVQPRVAVVQGGLGVNQFRQSQPLRGVDAGVAQPVVREQTKQPSFDAASFLGDSYDVLSCAVRGETQEATQLTLGRYYTVSTSETAVECAALPEGLVSVRRQLAQDKSNTVFHRWPARQREVAINALVRSYNVAVLETKAVSKALAGIKSAVGSKDPALLAAWARQATERLSALLNDANGDLDMLRLIAEGFCGVDECGDVFDEEEDRLAANYRASFDQLRSAGPGGGVATVVGVRRWTQEVLDASASTSSSSSGRSLSSRMVEVVGDNKYRNTLALFSGYGVRYPVRGQRR